MIIERSSMLVIRSAIATVNTIVYCCLVVVLSMIYDMIFGAQFQLRFCFERDIQPRFLEDSCIAQGCRSYKNQL